MKSLTFFDDELNTDFLRPIDATEARVFNSNKPPASVDRTENGDSDDDDNSVKESDDYNEDPTSVQQTAKRIDVEGFSLNSFLQRAKYVLPCSPTILNICICYNFFI